MLNPQTLARIKRAHAESALQYPSKEYPYLVVRCYRDTMEPFELVTPTGAALQAHVGQPVTVHVTSDAADELHVHSTPDHEFAIAAAPNQTFTFTINTPGKAEVELHHLDQTVATLDVTP